MATKDEAKFSIVLEDDVSDAASSGADSIEKLRDSITKQMDALKQYQSQQRRLVGSSDEVKAAQAELKAKINATKDAISAASLKLQQHGTNYDKATAKAKKLKAEQEELAKNAKGALSSAISSAGGPVASLRDKMAGLKDMLGGGNAGMTLMTLGAAGLVAAIAAITAAAIAGTIALTKWVLSIADAKRSANLLREAASGSAANALALGSQVDRLAEKVPTAKGALNELAVAMAKSGLGGQQLVDSLNAVAQANAALGDDAGAKIRELLERGKMTQRFSIQQTGPGWDELQGTGINRDDVSKQLAKNLKVGIADARRALAEGRVKLGDGAKAMRDAVEEKFGKINLKKMMSLEVASEKLKETLGALVDDINIEPLLEAFRDFATIFDTSTVSGSALKDLMTVFGNTMVQTLKVSMPFVKEFLRGMILAALDAGIAFFELRNSLMRTFGKSDAMKGIITLENALRLGKIAVYGMSIAMGSFIASLGVVIFSVTATIDAIKGIGSAAQSIYDVFVKSDWLGAGKAIIDGITQGLTGGFDKPLETVKNLAERLKKAFRVSIDSHSPSREFAKFGKTIPQGVAVGVEQGTPAAQASVDDMLAKPGAASQSNATGRGSISVTIHLHLNGGGGDVVQQLQNPSVLAPMIQALETALLGQGIPVPG